MLGLVPFDYQVLSTVTDHYMYLPMAGVATGMRQSCWTACEAALEKWRWC